MRSENGFYQNNCYISSVLKFGGDITLIYDSESFASVSKKLLYLDGILLTGGDNVGRLDFFLIEYAIKNNLKLLGICQGMQSMALYGTTDSLIKIGNSSHSKEEKYAHYVNINNSNFLKLIGKNRILVNSHHLQTVKRSLYFKVVGRSDDGFIEVVENSNHIFQIGVQWHPERMLNYDEISNMIINEFVNS